MEKVLITGIAGGQGRLLARRLVENYEVCGVDRVAWEGAPRGVRIHNVDLRKKKFEDVIRTELPTAIVHMGFVRHFRGDQTTRHDVNVRGTKQLLDHCVNHGVQKLVVISSSYVYGAFPENPYFMDEDSPLSASRSYAEIRDLVEVDTLASAFLWRYPHVRTCVLRPVNVLGYYVHSMIARYQIGRASCRERV
jgi:UDP-glucose 4-epimerase